MTAPNGEEGAVSEDMPERVWVQYVGGDIELSEGYEITGWRINGADHGVGPSPPGVQYVPAAEIERLRAEAKRSASHYDCVRIALEEIEQKGCRCEPEVDIDSELRECAPCIARCALSHLSAAAPTPDPRDAEIERLRAEVAERDERSAETRTLARHICGADEPNAYPLPDHLLAMNFVSGLLPTCGWSTARLTEPDGSASQIAHDLAELILHALRGGMTPAPDPRDAEIERLRAEVAELRTSVVAFGAPWAVSYAQEHGAPPGALHARHYDILAAAGARMDSFTRWEPDEARRALGEAGDE